LAEGHSPLIKVTPRIKIAFLVLVISLFSAGAGAKTLVTLQDAVKKALISNPEVQASWHVFLLPGMNRMSPGATIPRGGTSPRRPTAP